MLSGIKSGSRFSGNQTGMILTSGGTDKRSGLRTRGKSLKGEKLLKEERKQLIPKAA